MTIKQYLKDPALGGISVVTALVAGERPCVRTRETWFHCQGGGQRGDRGQIGPARVLDTRHAEGGEVDHFVDTIDGLRVGAQVELAVDPHHRRRSAMLHSAGHLIAEAGQIAEAGLRAVAGHHWDGEARVEFEGSSQVDESFKARLEAVLRDLIVQDLPLKLVGDPFSSRSMQIGSFAAIPCGGTHATSTGELASVSITKVKRSGGRLRVSYTVPE